MTYSAYYPNPFLTPEDLELYEEMFGIPYYLRQRPRSWGPDPSIIDHLDFSIEFISRACEHHVDFSMGTSGIKEPLLDNYFEKQQKKVDEKEKRGLERMRRYNQTRKKTNGV